MLLAWLIFLGLGGAAAAQTLRQVDLELVLAIDCSYSVDAREFELQKIGLAQAFRNPAVLAAIQAGKHKTIAVSVVEWSKPGVQEVVVPWTLVRDGAGAEALAARIEAVPRLTAEGATSISSMIRFGIAYLAANPISGARRVIDISADGRNNAGQKIAAAGALARAYGVTVNGLAILNEIPTLHFYFEQQVISGPDAFVMEANDYEDYAVAILRKLIREIGDPAVS
ncbi:MAG: DUF1194 domain-containing protein [Proteobacteria bacterium]|nr:DUF1194 domain-containing protein [Pseudomonadota bacterium]